MLVIPSPAKIKPPTLSRRGFLRNVLGITTAIIAAPVLITPQMPKSIYLIEKARDMGATNTYVAILACEGESLTVWLARV